MIDDNMRVPILTPETKVEWDETGGAGSDGSDLASKETQTAMCQSYCRVCGAPTAVSDWREERLYCSRDCRKLRNKTHLNDRPMGPEEQTDFQPLFIRAWHKPLQTMCEVTAIDYPADRVYVKMTEKNDYLFNAKMREFTLMTNMGNFMDTEGVRIVEGDVVRVKGDKTWEGSVTYDRKIGSLMVKEVGNARILPVTDESVKMLTVVGDIFRYIPVPKEEEAAA